MTKLLKTKCHNCKGDLYEGKFVIWGFSQYKYCTMKCAATKRLEQLRRELRAERISYGELAELQSLKRYIEPGDVELLEAAGVPEHKTMTATA